MESGTCGYQRRPRRAVSEVRIECPCRRCIRTPISALYVHVTGSRAVIRVAGQNGRGPINLFQKHDANHLMRPGRRAERNASLALRRKSGESPSAPPIMKIVLATDSSRQRPSCRAKAGAVDVLAALVQRHQHRIFPGSARTSPPLPRRSGLQRRGRGFPEFHESRGRESRACGRYRRSARDSGRPVLAPGPASAGRWK